MTSKDKAVKGYLREIKQELPGSGKGKKQILSNIQQSVENYLLENPDADWDAFQNHFGTPKQVAEAYIEGMEPDEILGKFKKKKIIVSVVVGAVVLALIAWITVVLAVWYEEKNAANGYYEIEIIETTEVTN